MPLTGTTAIAREIGARVRARRREQLITQKELARAAGVSERLIRTLEVGEAAGIGLDKLASILGALGLTLSVSDATVRNGASEADAAYTELLRKTMAGWGFEEDAND